MSRKMSLLLGVAFLTMSSVGCCRMADRWCGNSHSNPAPVQYCQPAPACVPAQQFCAPPASYQRAPVCP